MANKTLLLDIFLISDMLVCAEAGNKKRMKIKPKKHETAFPDFH